MASVYEIEGQCWSEAKTGEIASHSVNKGLIRFLTPSSQVCCHPRAAVLKQEHQSPLEGLLSRCSWAAMPLPEPPWVQGEGKGSSQKSASLTSCRWCLCCCSRGHAREVRFVLKHHYFNMSSVEAGFLWGRFVNLAQAFSISDTSATSHCPVLGKSDRSSNEWFLHKRPLLFIL